MVKTFRPNLEQLEDRTLLDAASVLASLQDAKIQALAQKEFNKHQQLSRADMIDIFHEVTKEGKVVNATELGDLATLVNNSSVLNIPGYVANLAGKVIDFNPANKHFKGKKLVSNGQLVAGDAVTFLTDLVDKWFLGQDLPLAVNAYGGAQSYAFAEGTLFGAHGPSDVDLAQGEIGDCFFLAALGAAVVRDPKAIRGMFISNGDDTYTVRFYDEVFQQDGTVQEVPDYVTVNDEFPESSGEFIFANLGESLSNRSNVLWVALAEEAYAQVGEEGWSRGADVPNSYRSINGGVTLVALQQIMGETTSWLDPINANAITQIISDLKAGDLITLDSNFFESSSSHVIANHSYYVTAYSTVTKKFTAVNPWGIHLKTVGTLELTASQVERYFMDFDEAAV